MNIKMTYKPIPTSFHAPIVLHSMFFVVPILSSRISKFSNLLHDSLSFVAKIRIKKEIITMRQPQANPTKVVGTYVEPKDWNELISDPDVLVLDTRNVYETQLGIFKNAVDPQINIFTDFVEFVS